MVLDEVGVARRMATLPERLADRLGQAELAEATRYRDVGEWLLAVESLLRGLRTLPAPVTTRERAQLAELLETFAASGAGDRVTGLRQLLSNLPEVPSLTEAELDETAESLPELLRGRVPDRELGPLEAAAEMGDWEELVPATLGLLLREEIPVTPRQRRTLWLVLDALELPTVELAKL